MTSPNEDDFLEELDWLKNHPEFIERPASISEFLGPRYLNIEAGVRAGLKEALVDIFGVQSNPYSLAKVQEAMITGAIGIGKTTFASIATPYMVHWVLCLKDPQAFFNLLPGSRIAFMQMSTSEDQAKEVVFGDLFARIKHSPWFRLHPHDPAFKSQIRWPEKDIWVLPGDSAETTFEGYNILGGILDEMDSHRVTAKKDYAEDGYNTISNRITSRFGDRGLLILIGQMKKQSGFAARHYTRMQQESHAYTCRMTIWESFGWEKYTKPDGTRDSFWFDKHRKCEVPALVAELIDSPHLMEIPNQYKKPFLNDPDKALKDLAGIPPIVGSPFIGMVHKIDIAREAWHNRFKVGSPVGPEVSNPRFAPWFRANDNLRRVAHVDIAYSPEGDALGLAVGHIRELKEVDDELRPHIVFDLLMRIRPLPGQQIILSDVRQILYHLRDDLKFRIKRVTLDGFQSTDFMQQLQKRRFDSVYLSVDRTILAYEDLRSAIYEERIEFPKYMVEMRHGSGNHVEIAYQELQQLVFDGKKVDHPEGGSKDVADCMAAVTCTLMGDRSYRRGISSPRRESSTPKSPESNGLRAPLPPNLKSLSVPGYGQPSVPDYGHLTKGGILNGTGINVEYR